jgi:hypothetical protein
MEKTLHETSKIEETVEHVKEYINTNYELMVLKASDKASKTVSGMVSGVIIGFVCVLALLILSFAAAYYLSKVIGDEYAGFLIVGGFYLLIGITLMIFRKQIIVTPFRNKMIRDFFND